MPLLPAWVLALVVIVALVGLPMIAMTLAMVSAQATAGPENNPGFWRDLIDDQMARGAVLGTPEPAPLTVAPVASADPQPATPARPGPRLEPGRHRRVVNLDAPERAWNMPTPPKLRTLNEQLALNIQAEAQRVQDRRRFVELVGTYYRASGHARVPVSA